MSRVDLTVKVQRVSKFLLATLDPRVFSLLTLRGFSNERRREGWALLLKAGGNLVDMVPPGKGFGGASLADLHRFENEWFDVVEAALQRGFPAVWERVFLNLHKTSDDRVILTTATLLDRLDAYEQDKAGREALALLAQRGFTPDVRKRGRELLGQLTNSEVEPLAQPDPAAEVERQKAEEILWAWYLDWSKTARTIVRRKDLRIKLGISSPTRTREDEVAVEGEEPTPVANGAPAIG